VLVISLGMSNDCPGMLPEQKVYITVQTNNSLCDCFVSVKVDEQFVGVNIYCTGELFQDMVC